MNIIQAFNKLKETKGKVFRKDWKEDKTVFYYNYKEGTLIPTLIEKYSDYRKYQDIVNIGDTELLEVKFVGQKITNDTDKKLGLVLVKDYEPSHEDIIAEDWEIISPPPMEVSK